MSTPEYKYLRIILAVMLSVFGGNAYIRALGYIPVMNYQRSDYSFGPQNWDITEDGTGRIYVANYNGMLAFDGFRWQHHYLPNYSTVRSLLYVYDDDRIYAGGSEEFGYFSPSPLSGNLVYCSLSDKLSQNSKGFSEVWDIIRINRNIIFRCDNSLFELKNDNIEKLNIPGRISSSSMIGRKLFLGMEDGRIFSLKDGNFGSLKEECSLGGQKIVAVLPYEDNSMIICTPVDGLFLWKEEGIYPFETPYSTYLKNRQIFSAKAKDGIYVFGTVTGGALIVNHNTGETDIIDKETGMKNNTVLNFGFTSDGNLWLCLDNGICYAALDSSCRRLIGEGDFIGAGYTSAFSGDRLLMGTNQGLYTQKLDLSIGNLTGKPEPMLPGQVWSITPAGDNSLFVSADRGIFVLNDNHLTQISDMPGGFKTLLVPGCQDKALVSCYDSFHLLVKDGHLWKDKGKVPGNNELKGDFIIDDSQRVWLSHWQKGIYLLPFKADEDRFVSCRLFNKGSGLPADDNNTLAFFEGAPVSSTYTGIFNLNPNHIRAELNNDLTGLISPGRRGHLKELSNGDLALINENGLTVTKRKLDGNYEAREYSGPGLYHEIIPGFTDIHRLSADKLLISTQTGFTVVNTDMPSSSHSARPMISCVYANHDSLIYQAPLAFDKDRSLTINPGINSLKFEFAYPECDFGEKTEFSSYLENFEKDWSPFSSEASREYTKLSEGNYTLHLKVRDNYSGKILESSFGFRVNPPWFRSTWAKGLYTVVSFLFLFFMFVSVRKKMIKMRLKYEKRKEMEMDVLRKESERETMRKDMEIAGLKNEQLEQEIKHKSDELSSTTMNLISKNEILRDIGTQISRIQKLSADAPIAVIQKNLSKLQASIEESISKDNDWTTFNKNFDIVYGDYMKRLIQLHPSLSLSEKRLCCYIRMGLSSKEIAPLINISYRSVEMARYRLRKKMNLAPEAALSDYLADI